MSRYSEDKSVSGESVLSPESVALTLEAAGASASASASSDDSTIASSRLESAPASEAGSSASASAVLPSSAAAAKSEPDSLKLFHLKTKKLVQFEIISDFDFNQRISQETQETILHIVFKYDLEQCIQIMRDMGAIINSQYVQGATLDRFRALSRDKKNGKIICQFLLDRGAKIDIRDSDGKTALDLAFIPDEGGSISDIAEDLIKIYSAREDVDINAPIFPGGETLFTKLVTHRTSPELVQYLIDKGAKVDLRNDKGESILDLIFRVDPKDIVTSHRLAIKKYVEFVGDVDRILLSDRTPILHEAIRREDTDLIKFLASKGAQFHIPDSKGKTALDLLCEQSRPSLYSEVVEALKIYASREGFDINAAIYPGGSTLFHQALKIGDKDFVEFLASNGAQFDIPDSEGKIALDIALIPHKNGWLSIGARHFIIHYVTTTEGFNINDTIYPGGSTLLHYTLSMNDSGLVEFLMKRGASVDIPDGSGRTALDIALAPGEDGGMQTASIVLIANYIDFKDIDINTVLNSEGETLLHIALRRMSAALAKLLIRKGAKVDIPDSEGKTALDLAIKVDATVPLFRKSIIETYMDRSGFDPDAIIDSRTGETLLNFAARHNLPDLIQKIIIRAEIIEQDEFEEGINYSSWRAARAASASATSDVLVVQTAPDDVSVATEVRLTAAAEDSALTGLSGHHEDHQDFFA